MGPVSYTHLTVEGVMRWYANELGHGGEAAFWALVGLLHDVDFEPWPEQHCNCLLYTSNDEMQLSGKPGSKAA